MVDISNLDLYALFEIPDDAGEKEIKTAYRKKALKCHPDKNPDNAAAIDLFHRLSKALEVLTDGKARDAYDRILKARKAAELRNRQLDSKRKKLKEDLESREREAELAVEKTERPEVAAKKLQAEIERLRKEGSRQLEEEVQLMKQQIKQEMERLRATGTTAPDTAADSSNAPRVKVQWKHRQKGLPSPYDHESLESIFNKHGEVSCLVLSKKNRAVVEFKSVASAVGVLNEAGIPDCPLKVQWLTPPPAARVKLPFVPDRLTSLSTGASDNRDYESVVMMRLRQAEERKRLIDGIKKDDDDERE